jgi:NitT/TauT family transport system ATP-binding protein
MIRFSHVTKALGERTVLSDISLEVGANQTVAILGPSGSGKTTLLRLIAGTLQPDAGEVTVGSKRIGFIFQDHRLLPWRTAQDNIAVPLLAAGKTRDEACRQARAWMHRIGLPGFYEYYPGQLSGGMLQRVSIARAFAIEPEIMLMDEPFSNLDASLADSLVNDLKQVLAGYRATTVYVTHQFPEAVALAQKVYELLPSGLREMEITDPNTAVKEYFARRARNMGIG